MSQNVLESIHQRLERAVYEAVRKRWPKGDFRVSHTRACVYVDKPVRGKASSYPHGFGYEGQVIASVLPPGTRQRGMIVYMGTDVFFDPHELEDKIDWLADRIKEDILQWAAP